MKVAIPTDDRKTVAEHFGRARYFWVAEVDKGAVHSEQLFENSDRHHGHGDHHGLVEILKDVDIVVCYNLGMRLHNHLAMSGIPVCMTRNSDIRQSIRDMLQENLPEIEETTLSGGEHHHADCH